MERTLKPLLVLVVFLSVAISSLQAQDEPTQKGFDKSKLFYGGGLGLGFGSLITQVSVYPQVGYRFSEHFAAGGGVNFSLYSQKSPYVDDYKYNYTVAGLNVFGRVYPIRYIVLQLQPEYNYTWGKVKYYNPSSETKLPGKLVPSLIAGAGAVIPSGGGALIISGKYDLLNNDRTPYGNRVFLDIAYNIGIF